MKFVKERVNVICQELARLSISQKIKITDMQVKNGCYITPAEADASKEPWTSFDTVNDRWYGPDKHYWFRTTITIPESFDGKNLWMRVHAGLDEWDDGRNPQFLLFANGEVIQGMDINHREVLVRENAKAGEKIQLDLQSYTGTLHSEFRLLADLEEHDAKIEEIYYDLIVPMQGLNRMDEDNKTRLDLETALTNTINLLDLRKPYSKEFYASIEEAEKCIQEEIYEKMGGWDEVVATCIGHTHIDVAWLWTIDQVRQKSCRSFATVLKLMDEYPNYHFMSSQPKLYSFVKERHPEVYEKIRQRVKEGRWEPEGGMWVEADCNLTSGESLVRQFMHGKRFFKEEFGVDNRILWLPDVFGYSGALPQIMKKCGIDYFMTTKLAWNQFNKVPYDTMMWRGIDGTEVLTHLITTLGVSQPIKDYFTTYNGMLHPDAIMGGWMRYQNKDINNDILVSYGYGDGGGGPTREMLETSIRMEKGIKGIPKVRQEFSRTYFEELEERVKGDRRLPVWEGEFYFEYHRGTYTSMARNKRSNRKAELGLMDLELLSVLAQAQAAYPAEELDRMWKKVLINQFHDILPGSAIHEVYEVTKEEYAALQKEIKALEEERLHALVGDGEGITIFNTTGHDRSDIVELGEIHAEALKDAEGVLYPVQKTAEGAVVYVEHLPSKGYKTFAAVSGETEQKTPFVIVGDHTLETPFYTVHLDAEGRFDRIYDKENDREVLQDGKKGNQFRMYEDKPMCFDNWDVDIYYTEKYWDVNDVISMEWTECGPVRTTLEIERRESNSVIRQKIHFYADSRRIEFETYVDWKEHQTLLKVHFPVNVHTDEATFDVQFGNLTRKVHTNTSWDKARFESCGQKWIDLSEGHYGVSMLNDCKYGHSVKDSDMALTLIKSGIEPNPVADQEEHYFTYAIYPHAEKWQEAKTVEQAYDLNQPAIAVAGGKPGSLLSKASVDRSNVVLETIKCAESGHGIIIRMYESENALTKTNLVVEGNYNKAFVCNLIEEEEAELELKDGVVCVQLKPYEVVTVKLV